MSEPFEKSQLAAAAALDVSSRTLREWEKEPWFPKGAKSAKGYDVERIRSARDEHDRKGSPIDSKRKQVKLAHDAAKAKREKANAELAELKVREKRGELTPRITVEVHVTTFFKKFTDACDQMPTVVAAECGGSQKIAAAVKAELDLLRTNLCEDMKRAVREFETSQEQEG